MMPKELAEMRDAWQIDALDESAVRKVRWGTFEVGGSPFVILATLDGDPYIVSHTASLYDAYDTELEAWQKVREMLKQSMDASVDRAMELMEQVGQEAKKLKAIEQKIAALREGEA